MALEISNQYLYTGRGPFDAKSIVKTYNDLLSENTWKSDSGNIIAYNGMIVAVWLDKSDASNNGIYYLYDSAVLNNPTAAYVVPAPDVTNPDNWHKISGEVDLSSIQSVLDDHDSRIEIIEEKQTEIFAYRTLFPTYGVEGKMYIAVDEKKSYVWIDSIGWLCVGEENEEPEVIYGGDSGV